MRLLIAFAISLVLATQSFAATPLYVNPAAANDTGDGTAPATAKKTIDAAYTAVDDGGEVLLLAGTYDKDTQGDGTNWGLVLDTDKGCTIKPDSTTAPTITLSLYPSTNFNINFTAGAAGKVMRFEGLTIVPGRGTRLATVGAAVNADLEFADCILPCGAMNVTFTANAAPPYVRDIRFIDCTITTTAEAFISPNTVNDVMFSGCDIATTIQTFIATTNTASVTFEDNTVICTAASLQSYDAIIEVNTGTATTSVLARRNTVTTSIPFIYAKHSVLRELLVFEDNVVNCAFNATSQMAIHCISDAANATDVCTRIIGNKITNTDNDGTAYGIYLSRGLTSHCVMYNEIVGFSHAIVMFMATGSIVDSNYLEGGMHTLRLDGGSRIQVTHNHIISRDYAGQTVGRAILANRYIVATSTTTTTFDATTVDDAGATPWGGAAAEADVGAVDQLIALVNAGTTWYAPTHWARVVSIDAETHILTTDGWKLWDATNAADTPDAGLVCKIVAFPMQCVYTDNVLDCGGSSFGFNFDFIPVDPLSYCDRNMYRAGTESLTNLASHLIAEYTGDHLSDLQAAWNAISPSYPLNDAHSQEITYATSRYIRATRWWRMPGWQGRINRRGLLLPL